MDVHFSPSVFSFVVCKGLAHRHLQRYKLEQDEKVFLIHWLESIHSRCMMIQYDIYFHIHLIQ